MLAMQLTDLIIAEKEEGTGAWYVSKTDSDAYLKIPFKLPKGLLLAAGSEADLISRRKITAQYQWTTASPHHCAKS